MYESSNTAAALASTPTAANQGMITNLMAVAHFVAKNTLDQLTAKERYKKLSITYQRYIPVFLEGDLSPGELAKKVGSSKQACSQVIKELDQLGLIVRKPNPEDGRSQLLSLSKQGMQLVQDGSRITTKVQQQLTADLGAPAIERMVVLLEQVREVLQLELPAYPQLQAKAGGGRPNPTHLNLYLQTLTNHLRDTLSQQLINKGFDNLKSNSGQILGMISRSPRRIQYIASIIGISKQAASVMATEFEKQGYVIRETDPNDRRQIILRLSPEGERLISETLRSVKALEDNIRKQLGEQAYKELEALLASLVSKVTEGMDEVSLSEETLHKITESLMKELGISGVRTLAQHLTTVTRGLV